MIGELNLFFLFCRRGSVSATSTFSAFWCLIMRAGMKLQSICALLKFLISSGFNMTSAVPVICKTHVQGVLLSVSSRFGMVRL